jgi:gluconate 2-dehydrogenase gamma chain
MTTMNTNRREFLLRGCSSLGTIWLSAHWPSLLSAAAHARHAAQSVEPPKLSFFTADQAKEVDAVAACIFPSDDTPGAREAGVVYFIDRALVTFARDDQKTYRDGLPVLQAHVKDMFPGVEKFSAATPQQQDEILHSFDDPSKAGGRRRPFRGGAAAQPFFENLRAHTIVAFLLDPDAGGDPNGVGWKLIGREREHTFQAPFGYYDKGYPGWQALPTDADKGKP